MTINHEDLDLDALEATARAATPGPWEFRTESPSMGGDNYTIRQAGVPGIRMTGYVYGFGTGMIEHIATFDPPTMLALIARLREAEACIYDIEGEVQNFEQSDNDALCAIEHRLSRYKPTNQEGT